MARTRVWSIAGAALLLLVLTGCSTGIPDPRANVVVPIAPQVTAQAIAADPSLAVISGTVLSTRGRPVPEAVVTLQQTVAAHGCGRCGRLAAAVTGADGTFSLAVPVGEYSLACSTSGATTCWLREAADLRQADLRVDGPISGLRFVAPVLERSHPR
jgi:Carboxypeptidase regulatory-like domain